MVELLSKLSIGKGLNILLIIFGCLIGPYWFLYQFYDHVYRTTDLLKLITLALSIGVPICIGLTAFNYFIIGKLEGIESELKIEYNFFIMGLSSAFCGFSFYFTCMTKYIIPNTSQKHAINILIYIYAGAFIYSVFHFVRKMIRMKRSKKLEIKKS